MKQLFLFICALALSFALTIGAFANEVGGYTYDASPTSDSAKREWTRGGIQGITVRYDIDGKLVAYAITSDNGTFDNYTTFNNSLERKIGSFSVSNLVKGNIGNEVGNNNISLSGHVLKLSKVTGDRTPLDVIGEVLGGLGAWFADVVRAIVNLGKTIVEGIGAFFKTLFELLRSFFSFFKDLFEGLFNFFKKLFIPDEKEIQGLFRGFLSKNKEFFPAVGKNGHSLGFFEFLPSGIKSQVHKFVGLAFSVSFAIYGIVAIRRFSDGNISNS